MDYEYIHESVPLNLYISFYSCLLNEHTLYSKKKIEYQELSMLFSRQENYNKMINIFNDYKHQLEVMSNHLNCIANIYRNENNSYLNETCRLNQYVYNNI